MEQAEEIELLIEEVCRKISTLNAAHLEEVCQHLKIGGESPPEGLTKSAKKRQILRYVCSTDLETSEDNGLDVLQKLQRKMAEMTGNSATELTEPVDQSKSKPCASTMSLDSERGVYYRKDFKISGQIGEPGHKDKLSFSSLVHQLDNAVERKIPEQEIIGAVIRAIQPGLSLRGYLESRRGLTMATLRKILRSHFREGNATDLYQQLTNGTQDTKESATHFLVRMMELRQKVLFASQEADSGLRYDPTLVQNMMLRSLLTGLSSDSVRSEVTSAVKTPQISDEELLEAFNAAASQEEERQKKQQFSRKQVKISVVQGDTDERKKEKPEPKQSNLKQELDSLRSELTDLRKLLTSTALNGMKERRRQRGCEACKSTSQGDTCRHCFKCGNSGHMARYCNQGNGDGLPQGEEL